MSVNYIVHFNNRDLGTDTIEKHHFGDEKDFSGGYLDHITGQTFVGQSETYLFDVPSVDPSQHAVLMFQTLDVTVDANELRINGQLIQNAIRTTNSDTSSKSWSGNVVLIPPNVLQETNNRLTIEAKNGGDPDNFIIDDVVLFYKTRERDGRDRELTVTATATTRRVE